MRHFASLAAAAVAALIALITIAAAPASAAVGAYRVDFYAGYAGWAWDDFSSNLTAAFVTDIASVFGTATSAVTLKDSSRLSSTNVSVVFTVDGGSDTTFLASQREVGATWTTAINALLTALDTWVSGRAAAPASFDYDDWTIAYISNVKQTVLPNSRYLELTLYGKHLTTALASPAWNTSLVRDLVDVFALGDSYSSWDAARVTLGSSNNSGVNGTVVAVRFAIKPVLDVAVNTTNFFATNGTAVWLANCATVHENAAYLDLGLPMARGAAAMSMSFADEIALTVTGTSVAPGDEAYTNAPGPVTDAPATNAPGSVTNAPGGAAAGVATAGAFAVAAAVALISAALL